MFKNSKLDIIHSVYIYDDDIEDNQPIKKQKITHK